jgi:hypothetical protein
MNNKIESVTNILNIYPNTMSLKHVWDDESTVSNKIIFYNDNGKMIDLKVYLLNYCRQFEEQIKCLDDIEIFYMFYKCNLIQSLIDIKYNTIIKNDNYESVKVCTRVDAIVESILKHETKKHIDDYLDSLKCADYNILMMY